MANKNNYTLCIKCNKCGENFKFKDFMSFTIPHIGDIWDGCTCGNELLIVGVMLND